ncbi:hypothetical protein EJ110_NYTH22769 [Nymphaea thermarum]|nr:hypothetical protein EJ110_NYTH22769 [Nymphaea thermarum]
MFSLQKKKVIFEKDARTHRQTCKRQASVIHYILLNNARVLTVKGIIDNQLGSLDNIVNFFKDLKLGDTYGIDMLSKVRKDINTHCERKGISKWADLRCTYFRSPWSYCSLAAALILLILTLLQVLYAMFKAMNASLQACQRKMGYHQEE